MPYELPGFRAPKDLVETTDAEIEMAGRDLENLGKLKEKSLGYEQIDSDVWALILPKLQPYVPCAGFDNMIFVAKERGLINNISQLSPEQLKHTLEIARGIQQIYRDNAEDLHNPVSTEVIALNFHEDPINEKEFDQKLHAQTLKDLHVHVFAFLESDTKNLARKMCRDELTQQEWHDVHDPFLVFVDRLIRNTMIQKRLMDGLRCLFICSEPELEGINLSLPANMIASEEFAFDVITLHRNFLKMYQEVAGIFIDTDERDSTGMSQIRSLSERTGNIDNFLTRLKPYFKREGDFKQLGSWLQRVNLLLKSGEEVKVEKQLSPKVDIPIFLRGGAYTLSIIHKTGDTNATVNLMPRILSTGNVLSSLGLHKTMNSGPSAKWFSERQIVEQKIKVFFSPKESNLREAA